jgi:hypothetical protein
MQSYTREIHKKKEKHSFLPSPPSLPPSLPPDLQRMGQGGAPPAGHGLETVLGHRNGAGGGEEDLREGGREEGGEGGGDGDMVKSWSMNPYTRMP